MSRFKVARVSPEVTALSKRSPFYGESVPMSISRIARVVSAMAETAGVTHDEAVAEYVRRTSSRLAGYWGEDDQKRLEAETRFSLAWAASGFPRYELSHSVAALLSTTRPPQAHSDRLPHRAFLIKTPRDFLPVEGAFDRPDTWIAVFAVKGGGEQRGIAYLTIADSDTLCIPAFVRNDGNHDIESEIASHPDTVARLGIMGWRLAANTIAFITAHRECIARGAAISRSSGSVFRVTEPKGVVISKEFRDAAVELCGDVTFAGAKRILSHMVRGHWRNQACGTGRNDRKLIWIQPHMRGDESLGRVVERIERITGIVN